jgi:hypothetical protein
VQQLTERTPLQVADIDAQRMLVRVRQGNGGNDRYVPLAPRVLNQNAHDWHNRVPSTCIRGGYVAGRPYQRWMHTCTNLLWPDLVSSMSRL